MTYFELVVIELNGSVTRSEYGTLQAARDYMTGKDEAIFKCILRYMDDEDMKPAVVARTY